MSVSVREFQKLDGGLFSSYRWTPGYEVGRFLQALRDGPALVGVRDAEGRVHCPPSEGCAGADPPELVPVGPQGEIVAHVPVHVPIDGQPLEAPYAFVLVRLDGADTAMAHLAPGQEGCALAVGDRVEAEFRVQRKGTILDLVGFRRAVRPAPEPAPIPDGDPITEVPGRLDLPFRYSYGSWFSRFYAGLRDGRILAARDPVSGKVLLPPRPMDGATFSPVEPELVEVADRGYIRTFTNVHMPYEGQPMDPPYCYALIVLDGADGEFHHVVRDVSLDEVRVGMRVRARWRPLEERTGSFHDIECFVPDGSA